MTEGKPPAAGTVIRYSYLWRRQADEGLRDGRKHRPAAIILARTAGGETLVVPITHSEPSDPAMAIEVPAEERQRIGLDDERSWIIVAEFDACVCRAPTRTRFRSAIRNHASMGDCPGRSSRASSSRSGR